MPGFGGQNGKKLGVETISNRWTGGSSEDPIKKKGHKGGEKERQKGRGGINYGEKKR